MKKPLMSLLAAGLLAGPVLAQLNLQPIRTISHAYGGTYGTIGCTWDPGAGLFHVGYFPTGTVYSFNIAGILVNSFATGKFPVQVPSANGLTWNPVDGNLYLVDNSPKVVVACTSQGVYVQGWSLPFPTNNPVGITYNPDRGTLIISGDAIITEWTTTGTRIPAGTLNYGSAILSGVAYVPQTGNYLVSNGTADLFEVDRQGALVSTTPLGGFGVKNIQDVDYEPSTGFLTVVCNSTLNLYVFGYKPEGLITYGRVCPGSGGHLPARSWSGALATGQTAAIRVGQILGGAVAVHALGISRSSFGPFPLPLDLGPLGGTGCALNMAPIFLSGQLAQGTGAGAGAAAVNLAIPLNPNLIGAGLYDQWLVADMGANPLGLCLSAGGFLYIAR